MPLTHAERQKRNQDSHESDPAAKNRQAAQKRVIRAANMKSDSTAKKEYERGLSKVRSQRLRDKKKLAKINGKRRKNGQPPFTREEFDSARMYRVNPGPNPLSHFPVNNCLQPVTRRKVEGQMSRYTWPAIEDVFDSPTEDIFIPWIPAPVVTGDATAHRFYSGKGYARG